MDTEVHHIPQEAMLDTKVQEVRLGRNFVRVGDFVKAKLPGKTQFTSGWRVVEFPDAEHVRVASTQRSPGWRIVPIANIKRVAQTKAGERKS